METENECDISATDDYCTMQLSLRRVPSMSTAYTCIFNPTINFEFVEIVRFILANNFDIFMS